jgi:hypothetical protein
MTTPAVTFVYGDFIAAYPVFSGISQPQATGYFLRAGLFCANDTCNPAWSVDGTGATLLMLLYLLTAHIAWLSAPRDANGNPTTIGQQPAPIVGRINTASEGSVSVGADMGDATAGSPSQAYYMQTQWGAEFWYATAGFRTANYVAQPTIVPGPGFAGWPRFGGFY